MNDPQTSLTRIYELLPIIYQQRDAALGGPLRALLQVVEEQVEVVRGDLERLYDDWFIETCQDRIVPLIGDLVGYEILDPGLEHGAAGAGALVRQRLLIPRREVANTVRARRRKGTVPVLGELAEDVAGWPGLAVEAFRHLAVTQSMRHVRLDRGRLAQVSGAPDLDLVATPFDRLAYSIDVRRPNSRRTRGLYNIPSIALFVWRLLSRSVTLSPATANEGIGSGAYTFSVLGNDTQLFERPGVAAANDGQPSLPAPIGRRAFARDKDRYYGPGKSLEIFVGVQQRGLTTRHPVKVSEVVVADLSGWHYRPLPKTIAVDPVLGRIAFPPGRRPAGVWVSYHHGVVANMGGGEYSRPIPSFTSVVPTPSDRAALTVPAPASPLFYPIGEGEPRQRIDEALQDWSVKRQEARQGVVEVRDSGVYSDPLRIEIDKGQTLELRAQNRKRPVVYLQDRQRNRSDALLILAGTGGRVILDGLLVAGRGIRVEGPLEQLIIRHCTLVPGWEIGEDCNPLTLTEPSLELLDTSTDVCIEKSILGSIQVETDQVRTDPLRMSITDSIIDATSDGREALGGVGFPLAHVALSITRSTVIGKLETHAITLADSSIFTGGVRVARSQIGCMRFSFVPPGSRTPRRYRCQPDLSLLAGDEPVTPMFVSTRYGTPEYARLSPLTADGIRRGAEDGGEMGAYHDLFEIQRLANLRTRLEEFTMAGMNAGVFFAT